MLGCLSSRVAQALSDYKQKKQPASIFNLLIVFGLCFFFIFFFIGTGR